MRVYMFMRRDCWTVLCAPCDASCKQANVKAKTETTLIGSLIPMPPPIHVCLCDVTFALSCVCHASRKRTHNAEGQGKTLGALVA